MHVHPQTSMPPSSSMQAWVRIPRKAVLHTAIRAYSLPLAHTYWLFVFDPAKHTQRNFLSSVCTVGMRKQPVSKTETSQNTVLPLFITF